MSNEYYLHDKNRKEVINLRDIINPEIYMEFVIQYIYPDDYQRRDNLEIINDDMLDLYSDKLKNIHLKVD